MGKIDWRGAGVVSRLLGMPVRKSCLLALCLALLSSRPGSAEPQYPPGFAGRQLASGLTSPTSLAIAPDGRIFVAQENGVVRVLQNDVMLPDTVLALAVDSASERGLLGMTLDPQFAQNNFLYVYYTAPGDSIHGRLSRFTLNGNRVDSTKETTLYDLPKSSAWMHVGGGIGFGPDGMLYLNIGDYQTPAQSQDLSSAFGKVLRLKPDGALPEDNPFHDSPSPITRAIWAYGFREPFTLTFQRATGRMFINDVGEISFEEVNEVTRGGNYGWPKQEGNQGYGDFARPLFTYSHKEIFNADGCSAVIGGDFFDPKTLGAPSDYLGDYFFADLCQGWIRRVNPGSGVMHEFASGTALPTGLKFAPDGSLYYITRGIRDEAPPGPQGRGGVHKVAYTAPLAPQIRAQPADVEIEAGKPAAFSVDAGGTAPVFYQWTRDGVVIPGAQSPAYALSAVTPEDDGAEFAVTVMNMQGVRTSRAARVYVPGAKPACAIAAPAAGTLFDPGQSIAFSGSCADSSGAIPSENISWAVERRSGFSKAALFRETGAAGSFTASAKDADPGAWYRIVMTARTARGAVTTSRDVFPRGGGAWEQSLGDLAWRGVVNGWGPVEKDLSNGGPAPRDGKPITLRGRAYEHGLGVHAYSRGGIPLSGNCAYFLSDAGVDDEEKDGGTADFQVWGDSTLLYESGALTSASSVRHVDLSLGGLQTLNLVVHNGGGPIETGVADWAGAHLICQRAALPSMSASLDVVSPLRQTGAVFSARSLRGGEILLDANLPVAGPARIEIRDAQGRLLGTPVDGERPAGPLSLAWRSPALHGLVFAVLKSGGATWVRRLAAFP